MGLWVFKTCEQCGREFLVVDSEVWAYKREIRTPGDPKTRRHWYCTWTCLVKAQRESDVYYSEIHAEQYEKKKARQRASAKARRERRKRESGRCNGDTSSAVPDNENKRKELSCLQYSTSEGDVGGDAKNL